MIVSVSGPVKSGKSTIINMLKDNLPKSTVYIEDLFYQVWLDMIDKGQFAEFTEIFKDRDFTYIYISGICSKYDEIIKQYENYDGLVVLECCYLDYLIYTQLHTWYHYPMIEYQENLVVKLLSKLDSIGRIYMTTANDPGYPIDTSTNFEYKTTKTSFKRCRDLELSLYNIYSRLNNVLVLPYDTLSCDSIVLEDLKNYL